MAEYRPRWYGQGDGSSQQWENCAAAAAGMAADRARKGVKPATSFPWRPPRKRQSDGTGWVYSRPTMSEAIRRWCNNHFDTTVVKGLYQRWVNTAVRRMYGVAMGYAYAISWATFVSFILAHRGATVSVTYSKILGTPYAGSRTFTGRHRVYVNERRKRTWTDSSGVVRSRYEFLVYDPLCDHRYKWVPQGPQWWPAGLLRRAMEASGIEVSYTPATA